MACIKATLCCFSSLNWSFSRHSCDSLTFIGETRCPLLAFIGLYNSAHWLRASFLCHVITIDRKKKIAFFFFCFNFFHCHFREEKNKPCCFNAAFLCIRKGSTARQLNKRYLILPGRLTADYCLVDVDTVVTQHACWFLFQYGTKKIISIYI